MKKKVLAIIIVAVAAAVFYALWKFGIFEWAAGALVTMVSLFSR